MRYAAMRPEQTLSATGGDYVWKARVWSEDREMCVHVYGMTREDCHQRAGKVADMLSSASKPKRNRFVSATLNGLGLVVVCFFVGAAAGAMVAGYSLVSGRF